MITKSSQRAGYRELAKHLASGENEQVRVVATRGVVSQDILGALQEMEATAKASNCTKHMFHVSASPGQNEVMTEKQWQKLWAYHEKINGLKNAPYIEIEHEKNGRIHRHRVYERVNSDTGKAINLSWTRLKNEQLSRMCEVGFGHKIIQGKFNKPVIKHLKKNGFEKIAEQLEAAGIANNDPRVTQMTHAESQQVKNGFDLKAARANVADCWAMSDSPDAFKAALADAGFALAEGDKMGTAVVVDTDGHVIPLQRAINAHRKPSGLSSIEKKEFIKMIPPLSQLPDVDAVREQLGEIEQQLNTVSQQAVIEDKNMDTGLTPKTGNIKNAKATETNKKTDKQKLLEEFYGQELKNLELAKYWRIDRLGNGDLQLKNKAGTVIDKGDTIDVNTRGKQLPTAAAALQLANLKGWDNIKIDGTGEFKRAAYRLAIESGINVQLTNDNDKAMFARVQEIVEQQQRQEGNTISQATKPAHEEKNQPKTFDAGEAFKDAQADDHDTDHGHGHRPGMHK